jgi:hypothetical protein
MSLTPWLPVVRKIKDGEFVDQATVNVPIDQLTQRDQHLYEKFQELSGKSVLISFGQPIHPDEVNYITPGQLNLVYYRSDSAGSGISRSMTGFSSTSSSSMFAPKDSNYVFGLTKMVYADTRTADLFTEGLCELTSDIDNSSTGLLQPGEVFSPGPYFLSSKYLGKITKDPSGIPVYVGYALSNRKFLLHTNVDEFSQFFINYRYHILDRVAGIPVLTSSTWTITSSNISKLGWVAVSSITDAPIPTGAKFFYNIPKTAALLNADTELESYEREEAADLRRDLPPVPANFIQLYTNGILERYNNEFDPSGNFSVNEYGIWWHNDQNSYQPWAATYNGAATWAVNKTNLGSNRKRMFVSFSKFNPALRTQLVRSLTPYDRVEEGVYVNRPSNFIKLYSKDKPDTQASTGDILLDIEAPIDLYGYRPSGNTNDLDEFTYPISPRVSTYTANRAIAAIKYSKPDGAFKAVVTPVVAKILGANGVTVQEDSVQPGVWTIQYSATGISGQVDSIEPINARLEFLDLHSYIKLPPPSATKYGLVGKIVLPKSGVNNKPLQLVFHLFGDKDIALNSTNRNVAFRFEYSAVSAYNGNSPTNYTLVNTNKYSPSVNPVEFSIKPISETANNYTAYTSCRIAAPGFIIPAQFVREDTIINFKITREAVSSSANNYAENLAGGGNIGLLGIYWESLT